MDGALVVRTGDPASVLPEVVRELGAESVHVTADAGPYGRRRDAAVEQALDVPLVRTGTPYAVGPGSITRADGAPYQVFTPFFRAWRDHGWPSPAGPPPRGLRWALVASQGIPEEPDLGGMRLPDVGQRAALERWEAFAGGALA